MDDDDRNFWNQFKVHLEHMLDDRLLRMVQNVRGDYLVAFGIVPPFEDHPAVPGEHRGVLVTLRVVLEAELIRRWHWTSWDQIGGIEVSVGPEERAAAQAVLDQQTQLKKGAHRG